MVDIIQITGYKWQNINGANSAKNVLKEAKGYPKTPESTTMEWVEPMPSYNDDGETIDFYWIEWDEGMPPILGEPSTFDVKRPNNE